MERRVYRLKDESCEIVVSADGTCNLHVPGAHYKQYRDIGRVLFENDKLVRNKKQYHIYRKLESVAFPYILLKALLCYSEHGQITLELEGLGTAAVRDIRRYPIRWYKDKGYERQVFIPLEEFS